MALYDFGRFQLDEESRLLLHEGKPVVLTAKVFDTLAVLVRNHGHVLEKQQLLADLWPNTLVEEANLTQNISTLRKALGDRGKEHRFIATIPGRGYSFVAPVIELPFPQPGEKVRRGFSRRVGLRWLTLLLPATALSMWLGFWISGPSDRIRSLAVLPFEDPSDDPQQEFFAAGMTEQLITDLSKIKALRVTSLASTMRYRGQRKTPAEIARELGVEAIVEGSVRRSGSEVRITARLTRAGGNHYVWADSYSRELREVLNLQREVAQAIARQIHITITSGEQAELAARRSVDPVVNDLVLRGKYYAERFTEESLTKAVAYFDEAIAKDPAYAPAHAGLAYAYWSAAAMDMPPREVMPKAKREAEAALQLDETLADAHVSLAYTLLYYEWDWPEAEKHLRRAVELNPSAADAHLVYAGYFQALGRIQDAMTEIRLAETLDPLSLSVQQMLLFCMVGARQYDEAISQFQKTLIREPKFAAGYLLAALAYVEKGQPEQAVRAVEKAEQIENNTTTKTIAAHVHAANGDRRKAKQLLRDLSTLSSGRYVCAYELAHAYVKLGDKKTAYELLEKGKRERADCMVWLLVEPWMDPLRGDPQYRKLIGYMGLATRQPGPKP
jgi:TolB-like protein/DNA-binding winged helix-turn-helix (wHTH) protein/Flp pilus assembly protein TadD